MRKYDKIEQITPRRLLQFLGFFIDNALYSSKTAANL